MMNRRRRAGITAAALVAAATSAAVPPALGIADAQATATARAVGADADGGQGTVTRAGRSMIWRMSYRLPVPTAVPPSTTTTPATPTTQGTSTTPGTPVPVPPAGGEVRVPMRWVAYGGSRAQRRLARLASGQATLTARDGVVTFGRRVAVPTAGPMSGGFCAEFDLAALGITAPVVRCPAGPSAARADLPARIPEVTVIADSVGTGLDYIPAGRAKATGAWSAVFDLKVCRRLVAPPCPPNPPSALSVIRSLPSPGDVVLIHVGYNDAGAGYDIAQVMSAMKARGVRRAVWVNLQAIAPFASGVNAAIRTAAPRYDWLQVADWRSHSAGRSWFVADRDHLTPSGAESLAAFYKAEIARAIRALEGQTGSSAR